MPRHPANPEAVEYLHNNYYSRGARHCAKHLNLTINQVWGLAARAGVARKRGAQRHKIYAQPRGERGHIAPRYSLAIEDGIRRFTATPENQSSPL